MEVRDAVTKELVGVATAVAGHCQPCLEYHVPEARRLGVSEDEIRAAIKLAQAVRRSGDKHMDEFAERTLGQTASR